MKDSNLILVERIERAIFFIRGEKVMLDSDLASLYGVETKAVNRAAKRNLKRFPSDFMFQLTAEESAALRYQIGASKEGRGGRRYRPYAFTEQGVAMLSSVLSSERAVLVNVEIMRAFVQLRRMLASNAELARRFDDLESKYDRKFRVVFDAIRQLMLPPLPGREHGEQPPVASTFLLLCGQVRMVARCSDEHQRGCRSGSGEDEWSPRLDRALKRRSKPDGAFLEPSLEARMVGI